MPEHMLEVLYCTLAFCQLVPSLPTSVVSNQIRDLQPWLHARFGHEITFYFNHSPAPIHHIHIREVEVALD